MKLISIQSINYIQKQISAIFGKKINFLNNGDSMLNIQYIKQITDKINNFAEDKNCDHVLEIKEILALFLNVNMVMIWEYDTQNASLKPIDKTQNKTIPLQSSFIKEAIDKKDIIFVNHIKSNKFYNQEIDNPLDLNIRSIVIFPIQKSKNIEGILKLWYGIEQKKPFINELKPILDICGILLSKLFKGKRISEKEFLDIENKIRQINENIFEFKIIDNSNLKNNEIDKRQIRQNKKNDEIDFYKDENSYLLQEFEKLKIKENIWREKEEYYKNKIEEYDTLKEQFSASQEQISNSIYQQKTLQEEIGILKQNLKEKEILQSNFQKIQAQFKALEQDSQQKLIQSKQEYEQLEKSSIEILADLEKHKKAKESLIYQVESLTQYKDELRQKLQEKEGSGFNSLKAIKSAEENSLSRNLDQNREFFLWEVDTLFLDNQYAYLMFELLLYATNFPKNIATIEETLRSSKLLSVLSENHFGKLEIKIQEEKFLISDFVKKIQSYQKSIFIDRTKIVIGIVDEVPVSLVFDAPKLQSVMFHILVDLYQFIVSLEPINIKIGYHNKILSIEIIATIEQKNGLLSSIFKQTKTDKNHKDQFAMLWCQKLIAKMRGKLENEINGSIYHIKITLPSQIIKM